MRTRSRGQGLSARCRFSEGTFAGTRGNGRDAPIADLPALAPNRQSLGMLRLCASPTGRAAAESAASPSVLGRELLFQFVQGDRCLFGIDPPALDRSLALFERGRILFIGQIGIRIIVSRRCNEFPQFDGNGIDTFFRDLFATGCSPHDDAKRLGDLPCLGHAVPGAHFTHL
jgi:hypothetical protein